MLILLITLSSINLNSIATENSNFDEFANDYKALFGEEVSSVWNKIDPSCGGTDCGGIT